VPVAVKAEGRTGAVNDELRILEKVSFYHNLKRFRICGWFPYLTALVITSDSDTLRNLVFDLRLLLWDIWTLDGGRLCMCMFWSGCKCFADIRPPTTP
jgi:hypothetical protein